MYTLVENLSQLNEFQRELLISPILSIDTETTGLDVFTSKWLLLQVKTQNKIFIFDVRKLGLKNMTYIVSLINSNDKIILLHNAKFDIKVIKVNTGIMLTSLHDTMITEVLIHQGVGKQFYSLKELVELYSRVTLEKEIQSTFINFPDDEPFSNEQLTYSSLDVQYLPEIYDQQWSQIVESKQEKVYNLEMRLIAPVVSMELNGVYLDKNAWTSLITSARESIALAKEEMLEFIISNIDFVKYPNALEAAKALLIPVKTKKLSTSLESITDSNFIRDWFKENINLNSPKQLKGIFTLLGTPVESTDENELKKIQLSSPLANLLLTYREHSKKLTTYGESFLEMINPVTGRIHAEFNQVGTQGGRGSSSNPNLQNLPKEESYRHCFTAGEGKVFLCLDYSQQEFRLAGAIPKEDKIIDAYKQGLDMHTATAAEIFDIPLDSVTKEQRNKGKTINFSVLYGSTEYGLAYKLQVDIYQAKAFLEKFASSFPKLTMFKQVMEEAIFKNKYSCTPLGRRRYFESRQFFTDYKDARNYENGMKREGFNHIFQSCGADATKEAMCKIYYDNPFGEKLHLCMQIHDEIVVEVDEDIAQEAKIFQEKCMKDALQPYLGEIPAMIEGPISKVWSH